MSRTLSECHELCKCGENQAPDLVWHLHWVLDIYIKFLTFGSSSWHLYGVRDNMNRHKIHKIRHLHRVLPHCHELHIHVTNSNQRSRTQCKCFILWIVSKSRTLIPCHQLYVNVVSCESCDDSYCHELHIHVTNSNQMSRTLCKCLILWIVLKSRTLIQCHQLYVNVVSCDDSCHELWFNVNNYMDVTNSVGAERMQAPELVCDSSYCHEVHRNVRTLSKYQELYVNVTKSI